MRKFSPPKEHNRPPTSSNPNYNSSIRRPDEKALLDNLHQNMQPIYDNITTPSRVRNNSFSRSKGQQHQNTQLHKAVKPLNQPRAIPAKDASFLRNNSQNSASGAKRTNSRKNNNSSFVQNDYPADESLEPRERRPQSIGQNRNPENKTVNRQDKTRDVYSSKGPRSSSSSSHHRRFNSSATGTINDPKGNYMSNHPSIQNSNLSFNQQPQRKRGVGGPSAKLDNSMGNANRSMGPNASYMHDMTLNEDYMILKEISNIQDNGQDISQFVHQGHSNVLNNSNFHLEEFSNEFEDGEYALQGRPDGQNNPLFDQGKKSYKKREYEKAIVLLKESLVSESKTAECLYLLGVCYLWVGKHEEAIKELTTLLEKHSVLHKNIFLLVSIAYKKLGNNLMAIKMLSKAISHFPKYYDAFIYRGKLYVKEKRWDKALLDFQSAIQANPNKGLGYIGKGDSLRMLGKYEEAVHNYSIAISTEANLASVALLKRGITYIELKAYENALDDFDQLLEIEPTHSEAYYFKGLVLQKTKSYDNAILCYEQSIKHNNSKKAVIKSLYEIAKIKIENKDFYEAYYTLHRADLMELEQKVLVRFKLFTEGVIYMMKRKHNEGVESLSNVLRKQGIPDLLKPLIFEYRAYGLICNGKIKKALQDYEEVEKIKKLDKAAIYNRLLCQGILAAENNNFEESADCFEQAHGLFKQKMEPYFYKACLLVYVFCKNYPKTDVQKLHFVVSNAIKELSRALALNDSCSNLYYVRALLLYCIENPTDALPEIEKAIDKADENYPKYFYLRGLIYASLQSFDNALSDLSITINLDKHFADAYLERGKCYFAVGDLKMAFVDIQKYITERPNDPNIHLLAGNLLYNTGAIEDAAKAYSNSEDIGNDETLLLLRAKCFVILKELNAALADLNRLEEISADKEAIRADMTCLTALKTASSAFPDGDPAKFEKEKLAQALSKVADLMKIQGHGKIFRKYDFMFYKGVYQFYLEEYKSAVKAWDFAARLKNEFKEEALKERAIAKGLDPEKDKLEMMRLLEAFVSEADEEGENWFEDENSTCFNQKELHYNKAMAYLKMGDVDNAVNELASLEEISSFEERQKIDELLARLADDYQDQGSNGEEEKVETFEIFQSENRLCSIFPPFKIEFMRNRKIECRLSFCLPYVGAPPLNPTTNFNLLDEINISAVESRPEAPWIKRTFECVQFTENVLEKEESEIENIKQLLADHNLNDDVIDTLMRTEEAKQSAPTTNKDLDEAVLIENEYNLGTKESRDSSTDEVLFPDKGMKKFHSGNI